MSFWTEEKNTGYLKVGKNGRITLEVKQKVESKVPLFYSIGIHDHKGTRLSTLSSMFSTNSYTILHKVISDMFENKAS